MNNDNINEFDEDVEDFSLLTLIDDNDEEVHFEVLDEFLFEDKSYIILLPYEENDDEVVILNVVDAGDDEVEYNSIDDEQLLYKLFDVFKERNAEDFNFDD